MSEKSDAQLLREYAEQNNENAFREIVGRHTDLVYSSALRQVGSPDAARDVAQNVFGDLARKARSLGGKLGENASLAGWLYRGTRFTALNLIREAQRREWRERQAVEHLIPTNEPAPNWERLHGVLDEAMAELSGADHDAVLLRFFNNRDLREVGAALGISDDAAQKRVSQALETLREGFARRGIRTATEALSVALAGNAVQAAPAGVAAAIGTAALAGTLLQTSTVIGTKVIAMTALQKTIVGTALAAAVGTGLFEASQASRLRNENQRLMAQNAGLAQQRDTALSNAEAGAGELERMQGDLKDLLRLRGEVSALRGQTNELAKLQRENSELQAALAKPKPAAPPAETDSDPEGKRQVALAKMNDAKLTVMAMILYAEDHQDMLPGELNQTSNYWSHAETPFTGTNNFELVTQGSLKSIGNLITTIVVREKEPWFAYGRWNKTYGFADGHTEVHGMPADGFESWEKQHMAASAGNP